MTAPASAGVLAATTDPLRVTLAAAPGVPYELLTLLGRGAMGAVYLAREPFLDRPVAVKVLPAELATSFDARERFLREARTAARLTHPNIVPLYSFGEVGDTLFYVMGYVDGQSLEARLHRWTRANGFARHDAVTFSSEPSSGSAFWRRITDASTLARRSPARDRGAVA